MQKRLTTKFLILSAVLVLLLSGLAVAQDDSSPFVVTGATGKVHIFPTPEAKKQMGLLPPSGVLTNHGGPIMTGVNLYAIFWVPAKLQNGQTTSLTAKYESVAKQFLTDYPGHGITNNSTQYNNGANYFSGKGAFSGYAVDTDPYPTSGCSDSVTPSNCITDAQLQTEVANVMAAHKWTPGLNKMYIVFTSIGEGSCFDSSSSSCAYTSYCAYHGYFGSTTTPTIYANMPYADPSYCYDAAAGQHDPSGDIPSDANVNVTSHEITEANTDPELNAWWDSANGEEIGDLCAWNFSTADWDSGLANQMWNGHYYDLQLEYDNHVSGCVKVGP